MNRSQRWVLMLLVGVLATTVGCDRWALNSAASFSLGWIAQGLQPTSTVQQCFENGVLIDCSELPENLGE